MGSQPKILEFDDIVKHNRRYDCWLLIHGKVYDVSEFMKEHPGGDEILITTSAKDASVDFDVIGHSEKAKEKMKQYYIGEIDPLTIPGETKYRPQPVTPILPQYSPVFYWLLLLMIPSVFIAIILGFYSVVKST